MPHHNLVSRIQKHPGRPVPSHAQRSDPVALEDNPDISFDLLHSRRLLVRADNVDRCPSRR
ncbi:uncharacterized protein SEPMUDRAFT_147542 [Sphaerulina musiva SO2202]|uniref:Uncharacterized protein n=1 Tax=Sphaerulina musiva (strain SO2202) TaxID=692275 RepID=M3B7B1_SPHMS|nr:uncharacterized protein SEPMUDRAFT_147542 [Sphaerulina musiva SO2202]EMF15747.1 hypothetical protein SEPMUDRAFT_147542 [Sphaerulina musiva SO2202]